MSIGDQCNNPGSMYFGDFAKRFGSVETYDLGEHNCAIFETPAHGSAALCELILNRKGLAIHEYILGGNTLPPNRSYSGGADYTGYMKAMLQNTGYNQDTKIINNELMLITLINSHSFAEGNKFRMTQDYFAVVKKLMEVSSKVWV